MSADIESKCKQKGVRLTDQRKLIAKIMSDSESHPNVDELHKKVSKFDSKISIATVYRTVNYLKKRELFRNMILKVISQDMNKLPKNITII